ncbi:transglycosylase domain-containing protein [Pseudonocardia hispaniensis]|uniref:Transglycosylase domain-containing protein n=1 Tax=Pseudonocardia hispaniensis TaxID=904933 RepID=A0ABW1J5N8_9PSEU
MPPGPVPIPPGRPGGRRPDDAGLLTHEANAEAAARAPGIVLAERPGAAGSPPGRDDTHQVGPDERRKIRWRRIRRTAYVLAGLAFVGPLLAFVIGWMIFAVPTADDAAITQVATFTYADGSPLATVRPDNINRTKVTLDQVPEPVRRAVLSAEDRSFYSNPGFDIVGIGRAMWSQLTGGVGGGSTITQQYVKVTTGADEFSLWRKYKEIVLAVKVSKEQSKDQILENYLNTIYLGRGAYGLQAASQAYFDKDVKDLTVSEGAMLAGLIQSPSRWDPAKNPEKSLERWNFVLDGMVTQGWLSPADRAAEKFPRWKEPQPVGGGIPGDSRGHIYNQVRAELEERGITETEINTEGLTITTTIEPDKQQDAVNAVQKVMKGEPGNLRAALVSLNPKTGAILAYYGGDNGVGLDYAQVLKQPGSSFKPFVLAAALQKPNPIGLGTVFDGSSPQTFGGVKVSNSEGYSCPSCTVKTAMTQSINTVFYQITMQVGPAAVAEAAHKAGIPQNLLPDPTGGISLGDKEVHPVDLASAFGTFAADGMYREPHMVTKVTAADGRVLFDLSSVPGRSVFSQQVARNVTESMTDVASSSRIGLSDGRPVAAKTGTVQSRIPGQNNDAWTIGYTPSMSTAVWVGTDDNSPIKNASGRPVYGRMLPGSIWQAYMNTALKGTPKEQFSKFVPIGQPVYEERTRTDSTESTDPNGSSAGSSASNQPDSYSGDTTRDGRSRDQGDPGDSAFPTAGNFDLRPNGFFDPRPNDPGQRGPATPGSG